MQVFRCEVAGCPKWFYGKSQLKMHVASHEEEAAAAEEADRASEAPPVSRGRRASERGSVRGEDLEERVKMRHESTAPEPSDAAGSKSAKGKGKESSSEQAKDGGKRTSTSGQGSQSSKAARKPTSGSASAGANGDSNSSDSDEEKKKVVFEQPNKEGTLLVNGVATYPLCTYPKCNRWFYTKGQLRSHLKSAHGVDVDPDHPSAGPKIEAAAKAAEEEETKELEAKEAVKEEEEKPAPALANVPVVVPALAKKLVKGKGATKASEPPTPKKVKTDASESDKDSLAGRMTGDEEAPASRRVAKLRTTEGRGVSASWGLGERPQRSLSPEEKEKKRRSELDDLLTLDDFPRCRYPGCDKWFYSRGQLKSHEKQHQEEDEAAAAAAARGEPSPVKVASGKGGRPKASAAASTTDSPAKPEADQTGERDGYVIF